MAIPKKIHYCWFGKGNKSDLIKKCIKSWDKLEWYEIIEWNEDNFDINQCAYVKKAYEAKKWAFVSDYVRLKVLNEYGGIYLDTDVEIKKDISEFLHHKFFIGFMYDCLLGTALIGSESNNSILTGLLKEYDNMKLENNPNNNFITGYFLDYYEEFRLNNKRQEFSDGTLVYPKEYFERPTFSKNMGYAEHHYTATWKDSNNNSKFKNMIKLLLGNVMYKKITHRVAITKTPFYEIYLKHKDIK